MLHLHGGERFMCKKKRLVCGGRAFTLPFMPKSFVGCGDAVVVYDGFYALVYGPEGLRALWRSMGAPLLGAGWHGGYTHARLTVVRGSATTEFRLPFIEGNVFVVGDGDGGYFLYEDSSTNMTNIAVVTRAGECRLALVNRRVLHACMSAKHVFMSTQESIVQLRVDGALNLRAMDTANQERELRTTRARDFLAVDGARLLSATRCSRSANVYSYTLFDTERMAMLNHFEDVLKPIAVRHGRVAWLVGGAIEIEPWWMRADKRLIAQLVRGPRKRASGLLDINYSVQCLQVFQTHGPTLDLLPAVAKFLCGSVFKLEVLYPAKQRVRKRAAAKADDD